MVPLWPALVSTCLQPYPRGEREVLSLALCPGNGWLQVIKSVQKLGAPQGQGSSDCGMCLPVLHWSQHCRFSRGSSLPSVASRRQEAYPPFKLQLLCEIPKRRVCPPPWLTCSSLSVASHCSLHSRQRSRTSHFQRSPENVLRTREYSHNRITIFRICAVD